MTAGPSAGRRLRKAAAVVAGLIVGALAVPGIAFAAPAPVQLEASDMALMNGVRLAGLWEMPAGEMAAEKGNLAKVREVGGKIADQHVALDKLVVDAANELGVQLPAEPNADQKGWLAEMKSASGARFDRVFVDRLRAAHGAIFPAIGSVRAGTRNPVVRKLAQQAAEFVENHMALLESTGMVRYNSLPAVTLPVAGDDSQFALAQSNSAPGSSLNGPIIWVVLLVALVVGAVATIRVFKSR